MKTTFKRTTLRNKPIHVMIVNEQIIHIIITKNLIPVIKTIIFPPTGKTNIICYTCNYKGQKDFQSQNKKRKDFCLNIKTYSKGQTYFFVLGYNIIYLRNSKGHICKCILKNVLYIPTFTQNIFSVQAATKNSPHTSFEHDNCQLSCKVGDHSRG